MTTNNAINVPSNTIARSGANADITSMTALTGTLKAPTGITSSASLNLMTFTYVASSVNYLNISNNATGNAPFIQATGSDGTVGFSLITKSSYVSLFDALNAVSGKIRLYNAAGTNYTGLTVATSAASSIDFVLPSADGSAGQFVKTDASGNLSFSSTLPASAVLQTPTSGTLTNCTGYTVANLSDVAWTDYSGTITYGGFSGTPTTNMARFKQVGKTVFVEIDMTGTSNATSFTVGLPTTAASLPTSATVNIARAVNSGSYSASVYGTVNAGTTTMGLAINDNGAGWTNSGTKSVRCCFFYETT